MKSILIISPDIIGQSMAGPGIRYWNMAKELSKEFKVILLVPNDLDDAQSLINTEKIKINITNNKILSKYLKCVYVIITQGLMVNKYSQLRKKKVPLVIDLYDPFILENLELRKNKRDFDKQFRYSMDLSILIEQIKYGDFFLCASEKQKDYWIGFMSAIRKLNPSTYENFIKSENFVAVVPFGISSTLPKGDGKDIRNKYGLKDSDKLLVWAGGIWEWMDPITLVKAVNIIKDEGIKCLFMGTKRPTQASGCTPKVKELIDASNDLELTNKNIFFEEWVPFNEREKYLMAADIGVTTYLENLEGEYSFRTRILDYIWANKPFIVTEGDYFAQIAQEKKLGFAIGEKDYKRLAIKILQLKNDTKLYNDCKENLNILKETFYWENSVKPLIDFCDKPYFINGKTLFSNKVNIYSFIKRQIERVRLLLKR